MEDLGERGSLTRSETIGARAFEGYSYAVPASNLRIETLYESGPDLGDSSELLQLYSGVDLVLEVQNGDVTLNEVTPEHQQVLSTALTQPEAEPQQLDTGERTVKLPAPKPVLKTQVSTQGEQAVLQDAPATGYDANPQQLKQRANVMVATQERPTEQTEINLRDLMSEKTLRILEGDVPGKRVEIDGKPQLIK